MCRATAKWGKRKRIGLGGGGGEIERDRQTDRQSIDIRDERSSA